MRDGAIAILGVLSTLLVGGAVITHLHAQAGTPSALLSIQDALLVHSGMGRLRWSLIFQFGQESALSSDQVLSALDAYSTEPPKSGSGSEAQHSVIRNNIALLKTVFGRLKLEQFLYADEIIMPVAVAGRDGGAVLLITGLASTTVYNTLQSTERTRATQTLNAKLLPALKEMVALLDAPIADFSHVGVMVVYASKDFLDKSDVLNLQAEAVTLITTRDFLAKYVKGDLSDDELLANSETYLVDRTGPSVKKVTLRFQ